MDNTPELIDGGFGLYSTANLKGEIEPIKTEYFRISLTRSGQATFNIGLEKHQPVRNTIVFGIPGQIFSLTRPSHDFMAYYMLFSEKFIADAIFPRQARQAFPFLTYQGFQCFDLDEETAAEVENIIFKINDEVKTRKNNCSEVIRLYIQLILIHAGRVYHRIVINKQEQGIIEHSLFNRFIKLVSENFLTVRKVREYAAMLHVSPDHLNRLCKLQAGFTAGYFINEMLLLEAKAYLLHGGLSVSEIAYKLEFSDPSHFIRFCKKHSGQTPLGFRKKFPGVSAI